MKFLLLSLFLTILVVFFTEGRKVRCFMCYTGRQSYDINHNFSLTECEYFGNMTYNNHSTCEDGCMKLEFGSELESESIYSCQDRDIDEKIKTKNVIQTHFACYSDFCNAESDWKIPKLEESGSKSSNNISPIFWICLAVAIVAVICCKMNGVCVENQNFQRNVTIADSSCDE